MKPEYIIAQASKDGSDSICQEAAVSSDTPTSRPSTARCKLHRRLLRLLTSCLTGCSCSCWQLSRRAAAAGGRTAALLPPCRTADTDRVCVIVDLDETLVHSSFQPIERADFVIPVEFDGVVHQVYVLKRPHVDEFLRRIGQLFECVLFTASLAKYADPVVDLLDKDGVFRWRLFRDACAIRRSSFVKDLSRLGRCINRVVIVDNSPASYQLHPNNAVAVPSWFGSPDDNCLLACLSVLEKINTVGDVYSVLGCPGTGYRTPYPAGTNGTRTPVSAPP